MNPQAQKVLDELKTKLRCASIAQIGGFRPSNDPKNSWFGKGVCLESEGLPIWKGKEMFPILQINVTELPFVPKELSETKLLVVFFNQDDLPFDKPNGENWLIREYQSLENLVPLPEIDLSAILRPFPIKWKLVKDDSPGWETAWEVVDLKSVNEDKDATNYFFKELNKYIAQKLAAFPMKCSTMRDWKTLFSKLVRKKKQIGIGLTAERHIFTKILRMNGVGIASFFNKWFCS